MKHFVERVSSVVGPVVYMMKVPESFAPCGPDEMAITVNWSPEAQIKWLSLSIGALVIQRRKLV